MRESATLYSLYESNHYKKMVAADEKELRSRQWEWQPRRSGLQQFSPLSCIPSRSLRRPSRESLADHSLIFEALRLQSGIVHQAGVAQSNSWQCLSLGGAERNSLAGGQGQGSPQQHHSMSSSGLTCSAEASSRLVLGLR
jgi:hypothetical protein